ncbi:hypothetical protein [Mycobacteroides chelonae]|uniref:hypothetical protein n=1 Tax=Mycobacteroides chelonae TaxID=1774 RepID=UPI0008A87A00|nr:hypothetical protein [Mycobacteroides chelonae]OHU29072.1 hypothetical protein BKG78_23685 [Mycobacteroides chelonae]
MPRSDRRGRDLKTFLQAEIVGGDLTVTQVHEAAGLTAWQYRGDQRTPGRKNSDDFPNAEELRLIAAHYQLSDEDYFNLLVEFGITEPQPGFPGFTGGAVSPKAQGRTKTKARPAKTTKRGHPDTFSPNSPAP